MNGAQDLGGMMGFGPVVPEPVKPLFHAAWEPRAFAVTLAMGATGEWTIDMARFARESLPPPVYLTSSYYQVWLAGLERLLAERDLVKPEEIAAGKSLVDSRPVKRVLAADAVADTLARGGPSERDATAPARFKVGDRVRAKTMNPTGHTRIPRYCRGHIAPSRRSTACTSFQIQMRRAPARTPTGSTASPSRVARSGERPRLRT